MKYPWTEYEKSLTERFPNTFNSGDILVKADDLTGPEYFYNGVTLVDISSDTGEDLMDSMKNTKFIRMASAISNEKAREIDVLKVLWKEGHLLDDQSLKLYILLHSSSKEDRVLGVKILNQEFLKVKDHVDLQGYHVH